MINLSTYRFALATRDLVYKYHRHQENPDDPRFPWNQDDQNQLFQLSSFLLPQISPSDKDYYNQVLEGIQNFIDNYNDTDRSNLPPPDVIKAYEDWLKKQDEKLQQAAQKTPSLSKSRLELIRRLTLKYPQVDQQTVSVLADIVLASLVDESIPTLESAANAIEELSAITQQTIAPEETVSILESTSSFLEDSSPYFREQVESLSASGFSSYTATYTTTAAHTGYSAKSTLTPTPKFEASTIISTQSPPKASQSSTDITSNKSKLEEVFSQIKDTLAATKQLETDLTREISLSQTPAPSAEKHQIVQTLMLAAPLIYSTQAIAEEKITDPQQKQAFKQFSTLLGLAYTGNQRSKLSPQTYQSALDSPLESIFSAPKNVQIYLALKSKASPKLKNFLAALEDVAVSEFDFNSISNLAQKHLPLEKIDRWASTHIQNVGLRVLVKSQNFAGDVAAKFIPGARPIVAIIKPLNSLLFLAFDLTIGRPLQWLSKQLVKGAVENMFIGAVVGALAGIAFGFTAGIVSGIVTYFATPKPLHLSSTLSSAALKVNASLVSVSSAAIGVIGSFLTTVFIVMFSIPIVVVLILFIINSSAYIVPSSSGITYIGPGGAYPKCWPVMGIISQGPPGSGSVCRNLAGDIITCSHVRLNENAFDIADPEQLPGDDVFATHDGLATSYTSDPSRGYGNYVRVVSSVGSFSTIYGHLASVTYTEPTVVTAGTQIGIEDSTGNSSNDHVHYELISTPPYIINSIVPPCSIDGTLCSLTGISQGQSTDYNKPTCYANVSGGGGNPLPTP